MKKIYLTLFLLGLLFVSTEISAKASKNKYFKERISNYFSGTVSHNAHDAENTYEYLNKIKKINRNHSNYNIKYIHSLVLLNRFEQAIDFSQEINRNNNSFFEADLLLGINSFIKEDYSKAQKYFSNLNDVSKYDNIYKNFLGNSLLSWTAAAQNNKEKVRL